MERLSLGAVVVAVIIVLVINHLARLLQAMMLHRTVREALNRDSGAGPELLERLREPKSVFGSDDRLGLILIALGAAMIAFGLLQGGGAARQEMASASVFPLFVGVVLVGRHMIVRVRESDR
ncbi:MAG TPA: hypothetical protein VFW19_10320 [Allosphingosinicella sp.]|nr:hypothetical protein [Allosphingosinicella sp.]